MVTNILDAFESATLPPSRFRHRDHVHMVWLYLSAGSLLTTLDRFPAALRRYAASHGNPGLYHETITWALVLLIHERRCRGVDTASWEEFAAANPDLFAWPEVLRRRYRPETLASADARRFFVLPDGASGAPSSASPGPGTDPPG
ncbi:MAG: hypothetical protein LC796_00030 [Acidobacteria bacterium]|nr:hypothetical protein [Acidobacteriota bacterium]MCA1612405.1 hypothetical protein [Acidobacteriota bacterium]